MCLYACSGAIRARAYSIVGVFVQCISDIVHMRVQQCAAKSTGYQRKMGQENTWEMSICRYPDARIHKGKYKVGQVS